MAWEWGKCPHTCQMEIQPVAMVICCYGNGYQWYTYTQNITQHTSNSTASITVKSCNSWNPIPMASIVMDGAQMALILGSVCPFHTFVTSSLTFRIFILTNACMSVVSSLHGDYMLCGILYRTQNILKPTVRRCFMTAAYKLNQEWMTSYSLFFHG